VAEALKSRQLPELYKRMILVGVKSGDLPGALTMLADYFQNQNNVWTRLKSMMTYPLIVMFMAFLISLALAFLVELHVIGPSLNGLYSAAWGFSSHPPRCFALATLQSHLGFSVGFGRPVSAAGRRGVAAQPARPLSLAAAGLQGGHLLARGISPHAVVE
jgi:hypothetical protein